MIKINLLPAELDVSSPSAPISPAIPLIAAALIPIILIVPIHLKHSSDQKAMEREVASLRSELDRYQPIIAQVDALKLAQDQLKQRKSIIEQLQSERLRYPQFMDDFVKLLPGNLWLTNLTTVQTPGANTMTVNMDVVSLDNYAIADLISNLETSQIFSDVDLGTITSAGGASAGAGAAAIMPTMTFHVTAVYKKLNPVIDANKKS